MPFRSRRTNNAYKTSRHARRHDAGCAFCDPNCLQPLIEATELFWVIENAYPYAIFDEQGIADHLLIVPKRHVLGISEFTSAESREFMQLVSKYDRLGYSLYARANNSKSKSVSHQHAHLMKLDGKTVKLNVTVRKPYINWWH
ncbi:MAG: hypothetical protein WAW91_00595 [Candidatus Nanoperiomorbaceae bacterium]